MIKAIEEKEKSSYARRPWLKHYDYWVRPEMNRPRRPLYEILQIAAVEVPDNPATVFLGAELTFSQIKEQSDKFATVLHNFKIRQGDRVGIMLPNCPQYLIAAFAVLRLGAIVVNINPLYTQREFLVVAKDSGLRALLTLDALASVALAVREQTELENIFTTSLAEYSAAAALPLPNPVKNTLRFVDLLESVFPLELPSVDINPDDIAVLQYTGGTTGVPKGAMLTHYNIFSNVLQVHSWRWRTLERGKDCYLLVIPFFHVYGFTIGMLGGVWGGARQILISKYDVETLLTAIRDYRPTYFPAVPTIYISLLNHPKAGEYGIDKIRTFDSGSAPLPVEVIDQFEQLTSRTILEGYGLSEASPVTHMTAELARRKPGSIGFPLPNTDAKIVDLESGTEEVLVGAEGELCISGPQVMKGYWNASAETAIALRKDCSGREWLYTGDIARIDEDGYFYIVQRKKDIVIVSGFNVYPSEVETVLYTHPAILEAAVIGVPDSYRGEAVKAFVVLKSGVTTTKNELIEFCKKQLTEYKVPQIVVICENLPKTAVGKILHRVLREEHLSTNNQ